MKLNKSNKLVIIGIALILSFIVINSSYAYDPDAVKCYNEGVDLSKSGNYQEAILLFRKATAIDSSFADAYYNLGALYEYLGNNDKALQSYEELVKRDSSDYETAYKVGSMYFYRGNYRKAISYLILISPGSAKYAASQNLLKKANLKISELNAPKKVTPKVTPKTAATNAATQNPPQKVAQKVNKPVKKSFSKVIISDFNGPTGIATDSRNNLYVANYIENTIIQISPDGTRKQLIKGNPVNGPIGLAIDASGNIYVASYLSNEVVKLSSQGKVLSVFKGISKPYYIYINRTGDLYVSEQGTNTVLKLKI